MTDSYHWSGVEVVDNRTTVANQDVECANTNAHSRNGEYPLRVKTFGDWLSIIHVRRLATPNDPKLGDAEG
jgi:hypothetical protein